jgi:hypothetical protein
MSHIIKEGSVDIVSMFFHSFQFLDWRKDPDHPKLAKTPLEKIRRNLAMLATMDVKFIAEGEIEEFPLNMNDTIGELDCSK